MFTIEQKRVYAELMGYEIDGATAYLTDENRIILGSFRFKYWNPLDHFNEILKGLSKSDRFAVLFEGIIPEQAQSDPFNIYLWIESHKTEILQAIYELITPPKEGKC